LFSGLKQKIFSSPHVEGIKTVMELTCSSPLRGSLHSFIIDFISVIKPKIIYCSADSSKLFRLKDDLNLLKSSEFASVYLSDYDEEYESEVTPLSAVLKKFENDNGYILLTNPASLGKTVVSREFFNDKIIRLKKNVEYDFDVLLGKLREFEFNRKKIVEEENDYAVRGGIIDVFPENISQPVRIEFFGNAVESIREFDLETQRSISQIDEVDILPSLECLEKVKDSMDTIMSYLKSDVLLLIDEPDLIKHKDEQLFSSISKFNCSYFSSFPIIKCESVPVDKHTVVNEISFNSKSQPLFNSNVKLFFQNLNELNLSGYETVITCSMITG
jgi:transcription-repair coupling factor (superfamily II helicase)